MRLAQSSGVPCADTPFSLTEGGEAGLRVIADGQLTKPDKAEVFMRETGAILVRSSLLVRDDDARLISRFEHQLAPCIGNVSFLLRSLHRQR